MLLAKAIFDQVVDENAVDNKLRKLPIWAFHGDQDPTVPLSGSTEMRFKILL